MTEREIEHISGVVGGITQRGEQWVIEVTPAGSRYAKKCRTKSEDTRAAAASLYGQVATFECSVSHGEYEGKPVRYYWINAVNPGAPPPSPGVPQTHSDAAGAVSAPQRGNTGSTPQTRSADPTRVSIERQTALKAAVEFAAAWGTSMSDVDVVKVAAEFAAFLETGETTTGHREAVATQGSAAPSFHDPMDEPDIPF